MNTFRVGADAGTFSGMHLSPLEQLEYTHKLGLEGMQLPAIRKLSRAMDLQELQAIKSRATELGLYSEVSVMSCNPCLSDLPEDEHLQQIEDEIRLAAACGWHELHTCLAHPEHRHAGHASWLRHLEGTERFLKKLRPVLREHGSRINVEPHGDITTFELVRLAESVGPDCAGICLDTANVLCHCEEPLAAIRRAAPYTHLTHLKDALVFPTPRGYMRQTVPPGQGVIDWREALSILAAHSPQLPLSIEDHKMLFNFDCFEPEWLAAYPDLTVVEFSAVMKIVCECQRNLDAGNYPDPVEYEALPRASDAEQRLLFGAAHLREIIKTMELH